MAREELGPAMAVAVRLGLVTTEAEWERATVEISEATREAAMEVASKAVEVATATVA